MTDETKLNKFIITAALKELQQKKHYKTLEQLREDLEEELRAEGFSLDDKDREKIKNIVEEEGYTGRFAIDDMILRKIKNRKYRPYIAVGIAVVIFIITSAIGGLIEFAVQKPLNGKPPVTENPAVIAAFFQLPSKVDGGTLEFQVTVQNQLAEESLEGLVLLATAGNVVERITLEPLAPKEKQKYARKMDIHGIKDSFSFNAYIIGNKVSFKSEPITIERSTAVAMHAPSAMAKDVAMMSDSRKDKSESESRLCAQARSVPAVQCVAAKKAQEPSSAKQDESFTVKGPSGEVAFTQTSPDQMADETIAALKGIPSGSEAYKSKVQLLELLAQTGSEKARKYIEKVKSEGK